MVFAATRHEAAEAGFDDALIYHEINVAPADRKIPFAYQEIGEAAALFRVWKEKGNKRLY